MFIRLQQGDEIEVYLNLNVKGVTAPRTLPTSTILRRIYQELTTADEHFLLFLEHKTLDMSGE